jgi:hypothetical protein
MQGFVDVKFHLADGPKDFESLLKFVAFVLIDTVVV